MMLMPVKQVAEIVGVCANSIKNWERQGLFGEVCITPGGHRRFTRENIQQLERNTTMKLKRAQDVQTIEMTFDEWCAVPDCPHQRDTERHLKKLLKNLSGTRTSYTIADVVLAELPNGEQVKIDGHTRTLGWRTRCSGMPPIPAVMRVKVYHIKQRSEIKGLYDEHNDPSTSKDKKDDLYSAFKSNSFVPESDLLKQGGIASGLDVIDSGPLDEVVLRWLNELQVIESLNVSRQRMPAGYIAAALLSIRKFGEKAIEFWRTYATDGGSKDGPLSDAVHFLCDHHNKIKLSRNTGGKMNNKHNCEAALGHVKRYIGGNRKLKNSPTDEKISDYLPLRISPKVPPF